LEFAVVVEDEHLQQRIVSIVVVLIPFLVLIVDIIHHWVLMVHQH
jgi:hypothetical protein